MEERTFIFGIAGVAVNVCPLTSSLSKFCRFYKEGMQEDFTITITQEEINKAREDTQQKNGGRGLPSYLLERLVLCRKMTSFLLQHDTLLVHGSCVEVDGVGYLFTAPSGTGKSTHARLWREMLGDRVQMVNDDKPFLKIMDKGVTIYGSPWKGRHKLGTNIGVPLKAICLISRDTTNHITPITKEEAYPFLLGQTYRPENKTDMERVISLVQQLCERVKLYSLCCNMKANAACVSYEAMSKDKETNILTKKKDYEKDFCSSQDGNYTLRRCRCSYD